MGVTLQKAEDSPGLFHLGLKGRSISDVTRIGRPGRPIGPIIVEGFIRLRILVADDHCRCYPIHPLPLDWKFRQHHPATLRSLSEPLGSDEAAKLGKIVML